MTVAAAGVPRAGMFQRVKEAASHTAIYGLGSIVQTALGFVLLPLYTRYYTAEMYGVLSLLTLAGTLAGSVFCFGSTSALLRSYYDYEAPEDRRLAVSTAVAITLAGAVLQILVGVALARPISVAFFGGDGYVAHVVVSFASSAVAFVNAVFYLVLRFERRSTFVVILNVLTLLLTTALILVLLIVRQMGVMAPLLGALLSQTVVLAVLAIACRGALVAAVSRHELGLQLRFGLTVVVVAFAYYTLDSIDRVFISRFASLADVGVYSLGYKIGMLIHVVFIMPFSQIWAPMRMEYRNEPGSRELFKVMLTYYWIVGLLATVVTSAFARELITAASGRAEYTAAYRVVPLVMLAHLFYGTVSIVDFGIVVSRKVRYHVYLFWAAVAANACANYFVVPRFGYMGAAWTTLATYVVLAAAIFLVSQRLHPLVIEIRRLALVIGSGVMTLVVAVRVGADGSWAALATKLAVVAGLVMFWYIFVLDVRERQRLV